MVRALFTLSLIFVVFTTVRVFAAPTENNAELEPSKLNRQKRTFSFSLFGGRRDWEEFRRPWPFTSTALPQLHSLMNWFEEEENSKESLIKRLNDLENGHKRIIEFLKKLEATKSANVCGTEKQPEPVTTSTPVSTAAPEIDDRVQTNAPVQPISTTEAPTPTKIATSEVEDKTDSSVPTKITTSEVEAQTEPSMSTKVTEVEVEDKTESTISETTTPGNKITSSEVESKMEKSPRPQETATSAESVEQVSIEKIETLPVDADTSAATVVVDTSHETTTLIDESNDINNVLI